MSADPGSDAKVSLIGSLVAGKYRVDSLIGSGSTGEVYLCRHIGLDKIVALKVLHRDMVKHANFVERFKREARAASRLEHPNSVRVLDFGEDPGGVLYIAMEYIAGRDLWSVLDEEWPLDNARIVDIMSQVLGALGTAHTLGIVHRDLKPENIMVRREARDDGDKDLVTVCDFGIAQLSPMQLAGSFSPLTPVVTGDGMVVGTPAYMSPEQARAEPLDARSDIYSAGVVLFQMLTRQLPFTAETPLAVAVLHCSEPPPSPSQLALVHPRLESVCLRALSKVKQQRYQTAREMQVALQAALDATILPHPSLKKKRRQYLPVTAPPVAQPPLPKPPASLTPVETERPTVEPAAREALAKSPKLRLAALVTVVGVVGLWLLGLLIFKTEPPAPTAPTAQGHRAPVARSAAGPAPHKVSTPAHDLRAVGTTPTAASVVAQSAAPPTPNKPPVSDPAPLESHPASVAETHVSAAPAADRAESDPDEARSKTIDSAAAFSVAPASERTPANADEARPKAKESGGSSKPRAATLAATATTAKVRSRPERSNRAESKDKAEAASAGDAQGSGGGDSKAEAAAAAAAARKLDEMASLQVPYEAGDDQSAHAAVMEMGVLSAPAPRNPTAAPPAPPASGARDFARASVTVADITSQSAVSKASIRSALNQASLTRCYRDALRHGTASPSAGVASLELSTNMSGRIATATVLSNHLPKALQQCFEQVARAGRVREVDTGIARATVMLQLKP